MEYTPTLPVPESPPDKPDTAKKPEKSTDKKKKNGAPLHVPLPITKELSIEDVPPAKTFADSVLENIRSAPSAEDKADASPVSEPAERLALGVETNPFDDSVTASAQPGTAATEHIGGDAYGDLPDFGTAETEQGVPVMSAPEVAPELNDDERVLSTNTERPEPSATDPETADAAPRPPEPYAGSGGEAPPPPEVPPRGEPAGDEPERPENEYDAELSAATATIAERPRRRFFRRPALSTEPIADREYYAEKRGTRRGLLAGGLVGLWAGRRSGRKSAEAAMSTVRREQARDRDRHTAELRTVQQRLDTMRRSQEHLAAARPAMAEAGVRTPEAPSATPPAVPEQNPEDRPITEATYRVRADRTVETSSWHRIEKDARSGEVVSNPDIPYGQEYVRELRGERELVTARNVTGGQQAAASLLLKQTGAAPAPLPPSAGVASRPAAAHSGETVAQLIAQVSSPVTWVIAIIIVLLLIIAGVLR